MALNAIGIACKDIQETINFYQQLGLSFDKCGEEHFEATTESGLRIMLDSYELLKEINPSWKEPASPGITLCFEQVSPKAVDEIINKMKDSNHKIDKEPWDAFWGQRYASLKDPNGNQIDIFAKLESNLS